MGRRIAILGGGLGGLAAAWRLSDPAHRRDIDSITVYQRGHRLGGKGASHRGVNDRIEEHGLHIWLGYYDNAFRLLRECYDELDREVRAPQCPIATWDQGFMAAPAVGVEDGSGGFTWVADFAGNDLRPGEPIDKMGTFTLVDFVRRSFRLLADYYASLQMGPAALGEAAAATAVAALTAAVTRIEAELRPVRVHHALFDAVIDLLSVASSLLVDTARADRNTERIWNLLDIILAQVRGIVVDGVLANPEALRTINHIEYRDWLAQHGAHPATLQSPLVHAMYGLAFGHLDGDRARETFAADRGLLLAARMFFDYKGSLFWKMRAGMGEVVVAPIYQALSDRGVRFEFFHRVDEIIGGEGRTVESVRLGRQVTLRAGRTEYRPLIDIDGLPCFPEHADLEQVDAGTELFEHDLESHWCTWTDVATVDLRRGRDFDDLVVAIPVGMLEHVARDLIERSPNWRQMVEGINTVATKSTQLWLGPSESELGWQHPGATITGHAGTYDTFSSMSHLLEFERWPTDVNSIVYLCCTMPSDRELEYATDGGEIATAHAVADAERFIEEDLDHYLPHAYDTGSFRSDLLVGSDPERPLTSQYVRANVDPADRYVQSVPGTDQYRLRPDESGFDHLFLAGDWTDNGINAGCIEAAVVSGLQAANAIVGRTRLDRITGIVE